MEINKILGEMIGIMLLILIIGMLVKGIMWSYSWLI